MAASSWASTLALTDMYSNFCSYWNVAMLPKPRYNAPPEKSMNSRIFAIFNCFSADSLRGP